MALSPPPVQACVAAHRKARAPTDDPSVTAYDVDMMVGMAGNADLKSHGAVGCDVLP